MNYRIETLDAHTWFIEEYDNEGFSAYMYLLEGEKEAALIDAGLGQIPLDRICQGLTTKPVTVFLTHGHLDHIGGAGWFEKVYLAPEDLDTYHFHMDLLRKEHGAGVQFPIKEDLSFFANGQVFDLGGRTLEVIASPGHSLGSVCFLDREHRWLFTGDTCCKANVLLQLEYSAPVEVFRDSIVALQRRQEEFDTTWPGHHAKPVEPEILEQYRVAAEGLMNHTMEGEDFVKPGGTVKLLKYKDIGIEY